MTKEKSFIGYVPLDLYRLGRKDDSTMSRIRERDIKISQFWRSPGFPDSNVETGRNNETHWIKGGKEGGISLFDDISSAPISGKYWWAIKKDSIIPSAIAIWGVELKDKNKLNNSRANHYTVYPLHDMPMDTFKMYLRVFAIPMTEIFKLESEIK